MSKSPSFYQKVEALLGFLFRDLLRANPGIESVEWSGALMHKLRVMRYFQAQCLDVAEQIPQVVKRETQEQKVALTDTTSLIYTAEAYLECFFYFVTSMLDILAKLTREFYPANKPAIGRKYFKQTIKFFIETDCTLDPEFTEILLTNREWILAVYDNRDSLAHSATPFIAFEDNYEPSFERLKPNDLSLFRNKTFQNLSPYLRETLGSIYKFLDAYTEHFRKAVPESDVTRMLSMKFRETETI
jgi:hypothetical protein